MHPLFNISKQEKHMNHPIISNNLNERSNGLKEKLYIPENVWIIPTRYYVEYDLSPSQALILTIIRQTSRKKGFSEVSYDYLRKYTKQKSDNSIKADIDFLISQKRIYRHSYMSRRGRRSKLVYPDTAGKYWSYLTACKQFGERKKFEEEFMVHLNSPPDPDDTPPPSKNEDGKLASSKFEDAASSKFEDAINTTYLNNNKNDVTCKGSDEPPAVSFEDSLRMELLYSFSKSETDIGMRWYGLQSSHKKDKMKKPIACIIQALKEGYAQQEVEKAQEEIEKNLQESEKKKIEYAEKEKEKSQNKHLALHLVEKFSHMTQWEHKIDSEGFSITNHGVKKFKDEDSLGFYVLPSGKKCYGKNHFLRVSYDLPPSQFKKELQHFFTEAQWTKKKLKTSA